MVKYQTKQYSCHFCGRSDSLNDIDGSWVCSKCWELIAMIASKWHTAGAAVLNTKDEWVEVTRTVEDDLAEAERKVIAVTQSEEPDV